MIEDVRLEAGVALEGAICGRKDGDLAKVDCAVGALIPFQQCVKL